MDVEKAQSAPFAFFGTMRLFKMLIFCFFEIFFRNPKGPSFFFFDILQQTGFSKSPKGLPSFTTLKALRLGYSADLRRCSRLVLCQV